MSQDQTATERPLLRVVRGTPDPSELAALVAVVTALSGHGSGVAPRPRPAWSDPARLVRGSLPSGGWRSSAAPR